jgi:hypothetical protein
MLLQQPFTRFEALTATVGIEGLSGEQPCHVLSYGRMFLSKSKLMVREDSDFF